MIFDCDGVLVDSERLAIELDIASIRELGWDITEAEVLENFIGRAEHDIHAAIEDRIGRALTDEWHHRWGAEFQRVLAEELEPVPGVHAAVEAVAAMGLASCVASSGSHAKMRRTLGRTGLWDHFAGRIFSASEVARGKPAPDLFLHAAARMGVPPSRCAVVEDSRFGVAGAKAAGMAAVGYAGGITPGHHLTEADVVIKDMTELPDAVTQLLS
ncbi:HAD family hydrolase [Intrasporangium calvum]|nr:HAD family hydrolase [Intrasporangium calvum]